MNRFKRISRRTLLMGAGATLGLPALDIMQDDRGRFFVNSARAATSPPVRILTWFMPNGVHPSVWHPAQEGTDYELTALLEPLAEFKTDFSVLTGLDANRESILTDGHIVGTGTFANGMPITNLGAGGPSLDQVAAKLKGAETRFASLVLAAGPESTTVQESVSGAVISNISWVAKQQRAPAIRDERVLFSKLFGASGSTAEDAYRAQSRKSVLDLVKSEAVSLSAVVGPADRQKIDAHLSAVRELERSIFSPPTNTDPICAVGPERPAAPLDGVRRAEVMNELLAIALKCDMTRYGSFMVTNGRDCDNESGLCDARNSAVAQALGTSTLPAQHNCHHDGNMPGILGYGRLHVGFFARLLKSLKATPEGNGTVLDNCLIYMGSELGNGGAHDVTNLPLILAGKGGGTVTTGRHVRFGGLPAARLMLSVLQRAGLGVTEFAKQVEPLPGI
ncbi:MAG: DUF1552 domain-containing protein [Polyangiaceae bacterium]|nr:DUF1552 domain-containing protein [Polyangiaceae bacterium]